MSYKEQFAQARKDKTAKSLSARYVEWKEKGQVVVGKLIATNDVAGKLAGSSYRQYLFESDDGLIKFAFGKATDNEAGQLMAIGGVYAITFGGQEKITGGRKINRFDVLELAAPADDAVGGGSDIPI